MLTADSWEMPSIRPSDTLPHAGTYRFPQRGKGESHLSPSGRETESEGFTDVSYVLLMFGRHTYFKFNRLYS